MACSMISLDVGFRHWLQNELFVQVTRVTVRSYAHGLAAHLQDPDQLVTIMTKLLDVTLSI